MENQAYEISGKFNFKNFKDKSKIDNATKSINNDSITIIPDTILCTSKFFLAIPKEELLSYVIPKVDFERFEYFVIKTMKYCFGEIDIDDINNLEKSFKSWKSILIFYLIQEDVIKQTELSINLHGDLEKIYEESIK